MVGVPFRESHDITPHVLPKAKNFGASSGFEQLKKTSPRTREGTSEGKESFVLCWRKQKTTGGKGDASGAGKQKTPVTRTDLGEKMLEVHPPKKYIG